VRLWINLIGLFGIWFIVYEGGVVGVAFLVAIIALAIWLHHQNNKRFTKPHRTRRLSIPRTTPPIPRKASIMSNAQPTSILSAVEQLSPSIMRRSGSLFYSGPSAFHGKPPLYVLGLNPGGSPVTQAIETVECDLADWRALKSPWSAYLDESWQGKATGTHGMQPRMLHMFDRLGLDLREIPASNVVFVRSANEAALASEKAALLSQCWPVHAAVIRDLGIRTILCLGTTAGRWTREAIGAHTPIDRFQESNGRGWSSEAHIAADGRAVVTVTHPGRADWRNPAADPTPLVKAVLERQQ
jgi:hypothetical protein